MVNQNYKIILIPSFKFKKNYNGIEIYREIAKKLGLTDVIEVEEKGDALEDAKTIGKIANSTDKKSLIIGLEHYLTAFVGKTPETTDYIFFDAHADDEFPECNFFYDGSFVNFMKGDCYFIGIRESEFQYKSKGINKGRSILLNYCEPEKIAKMPFKNNIFLSLDIDVFHPSITTAHRWSEPPFGFEGRMTFEQVKNLSLKITQGRKIVGINIAEYAPFYDKDSGYKTLKLVVDFLRPLL